jgi:hypothetical protein
MPCPGAWPVVPEDASRVKKLLNWGKYISAVFPMCNFLSKLLASYKGSQLRGLIELGLLF